MVDRARLESVCTARYRGFESRPLRFLSPWLNPHDFIYLPGKKSKQDIHRLYYIKYIATSGKKISKLPRTTFLLEQINLHYSNFVPDVTLHDHYSFPSVIPLQFLHDQQQWLWFSKYKNLCRIYLNSLLVGYSRIYLARYFVIDVLSGAIIGVACALLGYYQVYDLKLLRSLKTLKHMQFEPGQH